MLHDFLLANKINILRLIEEQVLALDDLDKPSSRHPREGLVVFLNQLITAFQADVGAKSVKIKLDQILIVPIQADMIASAGVYGHDFLRLGFQLSHIVRAYGIVCQSITQLATEKDIRILSSEFRKLNLYLDLAMASAVTEYQAQNFQKMKAQEIESLGSLAHELRNALNSINISLHIIKSSQVGFSGRTGQILELNLKRMNDLIDRSLTKVRLRAEPSIHTRKTYLFKVVNQILETALIEARAKGQNIETQVDLSLMIEIDEQLFYSALSNLVQNALKYSPIGACIQIRGFISDKNVVIEVEDECGGLKNEGVDLFKPFVQQNENRKGLGLGLTIAQKALEMHQGKIEVQNLQGKCCIFRILLPLLKGE